MIFCCCLVWPAGAAAVEAPVLRGTLVERHTDAFDGGQPSVAYSLRTAAGDVELADDQRAGLIGQRVQVEDASARTGVQGRATAQDSTRLASSTGLGPHRVAVLMVNFSDRRSTPVTADAIRSTVFTGATSVDAFFRSQSDGAVSLEGDVHGWYELPTSSGTCDSGGIARAARAAATADGVDLGSYDHVVYFFPTLSTCGYAGLGELPGSQTWINGSNQTGLIAHELGHNMGVHHAASRACSSGGSATPISATCTDTEYGDPFDVMGNGSRLMSSWHRAQLGQLPAARQRTVLTSGTYTVGSANDFGSAATKLLLVPRPGTSQLFAVEIRSPLAPFDGWSTTAPAATGVSVRLVPQLTRRTQSYLLDANPADGGFANAPLQPGQSMADAESGVTIANLASGGGSASVAVTLPRSTDTTAPTPPSDVRASLSGSAVRVTWGASTDDDAIARYEVLRNGVLLASTQATSFGDSSWAGLASASYRVDAVDPAGNRSSSASRPTVALPVPAAPTAASVPPRVPVAPAVPSRPKTPKPPATAKAVMAPSVSLRSPRLRAGRARLGANGRLVFRASRTGRLELVIAGRTVRTTTGKRLVHVLRKRYRKRAALRLRVVVRIDGRRAVARYVVRRGVVRRA